MELHDFSQLPVLANRRLKGVVTWETIGRALAKNSDASLTDCTETVCPSVSVDSELLKAIPLINAHGFVVATNEDKTVSGIVTGADLGVALASIAGPYILLEKIETTMRYVIESLRIRDNEAVVSISDAVRSRNNKPAVLSSEDLTLGELEAVFCHEDLWPHLPGSYHRETISQELQNAVKLRNLLMHFRDLNSNDPVPALENLAEVLGEIWTRLTTSK